VKYDPKTNRYRNAKGRFISAREVRKAIDKTVDIVRGDMRSLGKKLAAGEITLPEFQTQMRDNLKAAHSLTASIGKGGRGAMTARDWSAVGNTLKKEYRYLNNFARQVEQQRLSAAQIEYRSSSYASSVRTTYFKTDTVAKKDAGLTRVKRVLHAMESCAGCLSWAGKGFVPIDEMPALGELECRNFCRCELEYK